MGRFGFSYVGLLYLLMLFIPNALWAKRQPAGYDFRHENKVLLALERVGQVCVTYCALFFRDFNPSGLSAWEIWLAASLVLMILYELYWVRYFRGTRTLADFYGPFCGIPVPGASLPVAAFLLLGLYGKVIWMIAAVVVFGAGHIGIHGQHIKRIKDSQSDIRA